MTQSIKRKDRFLSFGKTLFLLFAILGRLHAPCGPIHFGYLGASLGK